MSGKTETPRTIRTAEIWPPEGLSRTEAARYIGVSATTFDSLVENGEMPRARRFRHVKRLIWLRRELDQHLADLPVDGGEHTGMYDGVEL